MAEPGKWMRQIARAVLLACFAASVAWLVLDGPIGRRIAADRIAAWAPKSGLRIEVGRIDGSLLGQAHLRQVVLLDPDGVFAEIPEADLDWRPMNWFSSGLDVRALVLHRGRLLRLPHLLPGDPDAPILPDFDIRIDRFEIRNMRVEEGIAGKERRIDLEGRALVRSGVARVSLDGRLGGRDRLQALLDAQPARDRFALRLDYAAPAGGLLAGLAGTRRDSEAVIVGNGGWQRWDGAFLARSGGTSLAALQLGNRAGQFSVRGLAWPDGLLKGLAGRAAGSVVAIDGSGRMAEKVVDGRLALSSRAARFVARGKVDLAGNAFDGMDMRLALADPHLLGGNFALEDPRLVARLDGSFKRMTAQHTFSAGAFRSGKLAFLGLSSEGVARRDEDGWHLPLALHAARVETGDPAYDSRLAGLRIGGTLDLAGSKLQSRNLGISVPGLAAQLVLKGDTAAGAYGLAGVAAARGWLVPDLGLANADARLMISAGRAKPWRMAVNFAGRLPRVDNATLTSIAGENIRFSGGIRLGAGMPLAIDRVRLDATRLNFAASGSRQPDGRTRLAGSGRHATYGPFRVEAEMAGDGPRAAFVFADPYPAAGLRDVRLSLSPIPDGFHIDTEGGSTLGPFTGSLGLFARKGQDTRLSIERLTVSKTSVSGSLLILRGAAAGQLALSGGGLAGSIGLSPRGGGQGIDLAINAEDASFGGETPLVIGTGRLEAQGTIAHDRSTIAGNLFGQGISYGSAFIGRVAANARLADGSGQVTASLAGRRGSRFALQLHANVGPGRIALAGQGDFAGKRISMPRRAVLTREQDGWRLARSQVSFGGGRVIASGLIGTQASDIELAMAAMPLSLADVVMPDLGFGGSASGLVRFRSPRTGVPTGSARLQVSGLTRSGLVLTSRPIDLALVADLSASALEARAVMRDNGVASGRLQARIAGMPAAGSLGERLRGGALVGQLRYAGPADAIWRLVALEEFDLKGPVRIAADVGGSIPAPRLVGNMSSDGLRLQSALTGTDISGIVARGHFSGSRLDVTSFAGRAANGGQVVGSGSFDLSGLGEHAPGLDLRISAHNALVLARSDMAATVTGPLRIVSDGITGTIAGRLRLDSARWSLGRAAAAVELPDIATREVNRRADMMPSRRVRASWRYLIDAAGANRIAVSGLGLDSEWSADIRLRGTTRAPTIDGRADLVRGGYEFAGKRFELVRGRILFAGESPPDPRLDIVAEAQESGVTARVTVAGSSLRPEVRFTSTPALPEEELLSRLLFGASITEVSAPEALQLGAALASLRSGGGLDPINKLRKAVGLDRLRIVGADAASGRGTGIAAGKYLGRRFYAEIVTDGRGYSATQLEFRVTSWLALLATLSSTGRQGMNLKASKDY